MSIEYDGRGHDLCVRLRKVDRNKFDKNEIDREDFLINSGYKILRIINDNDSKFEKDKIIEVKNMALKYFENGISVFRYNLNTCEYNYR